MLLLSSEVVCFEWDLFCHGEKREGEKSDMVVSEE